jgi:succinate-acetate transporter protein
MGSHSYHGRGSQDGAVDWDSQESWAARTRIVLSPVAAPSILGLFGFASATFMVASLLAGWWGNPTIASPILAPFVLFFGGLAQLLAGMWSYKARHGVATAFHGTWGSFYLAWGLLGLLVGGGMFPTSVLSSRALGFWLIVAAVTTIFIGFAALADNLAMFVVAGLLAGGASLLAAGFVGGVGGVVVAGGWVLVASAAAAWYTAGALMLAGAFKGRTILPLGSLDAAGNIPGRKAMEPIDYPGGMPGAKVGQ